MKTNWGEFRFVSVDSIKLENDMIQITNLVCVPCETKIIKPTSTGSFEGVMSSPGFHVVFPYIEAPINEIFYEIPELQNMISEIINEVANAEKEDNDEEDSGSNT